MDDLARAARAQDLQHDHSDHGIPRPTFQREPIRSEIKLTQLPASTVLDGESLLQTSEPGRGGTNRSRIYWITPFTMVTCFIAGLAFAVGHRLFYRSLNGKAVGSINSQQ